VDVLIVVWTHWLGVGHPAAETGPDFLDDEPGFAAPA
jgi:hypothetical protein